MVVHNWHQYPCFPVILMNMDYTLSQGDPMKSTFWAIVILISTVGTIGVNALANILPLNGRFTGEISDSVPNLFAPAGITFAIWALIYLSLVFFSFLCLGFLRDYSPVKRQIPYQLGPIYFLSAVANGAWIFAWHWLQFPLSLGLMLILLLSLIYLYVRIREITRDWPRFGLQTILLKGTFSLYLGWITVATVANGTTVLVHGGFSGNGQAVFWMIGILAVIYALGAVHAFRTRDLIYQAVLMWALAGIALKRLDPAFDPYEPVVGWVAAVVGALLFITWVVAVVRHPRKDRFGQVR